MIELHTVPTANGYKAAIMLEEVGLPYSVKSYDLKRGDQRQPDFLVLNPFGRLPLIVDNSVAPPISVYGSVAIVLYLAEKTGQLLPAAPATRAKVFEWLGIISSDIGPSYAGQFIFNLLAPEKQEWSINFYNKQCLRLIGVMDAHLAHSSFLAGNDYTIADVIAYPVAATSMMRYPGNLSGHPNIKRWAEQIGARAAVQRGMKVPAN